MIAVELHSGFKNLIMRVVCNNEQNLRELAEAGQSPAFNYNNLIINGNVHYLEP